MTALFLLILLGAITYFIVHRVSGVTRTPWWLLWLVAMTPAFIWTGWALIVGNDRPMPSPLVIVPFVTCLVLYWFLIQWGRISSPPPVNSSAAPSAETPDATKQPVSDPASLRPINKAEESSLQTCFPWTVYYLQNIEYRAQAIICRGQLRSKSEVAYQTIRENIEEKFGDRFYVVFQEAPNGKPVFVLVPNPQSRSAAAEAGQATSSELAVATPGSAAKPQTERLTRPGVAGVLLLLTLLTMTLGWLELKGELNQLSPATFVQGLPYALALAIILGTHELAHYLAARRYQMRATLPYFIPVLPLPIFPFGTFGAFIQIRSPMPHRRALFDVGIAGPIAGFIAALPLLLWGLAHSQVVPLPAKPEILNFQALNPNFSLLLALLSKLVLGNALTPETGINLHPVAVAACLGIVVTAFNLMPVGQLDGGHIVHAMFGQRTGAAIGQIARLLMLLLSLVQPYLIVWAIFLFVISASDEPALNDVTELDNQRDFWGLVSLGLLLLIILPTPTSLARLLNV